MTDVEFSVADYLDAAPAWDQLHAELLAAFPGSFVGVSSDSVAFWVHFGGDAPSDADVIAVLEAHPQPAP